MAQGRWAMGSAKMSKLQCGGLTLPWIPIDMSSPQPKLQRVASGELSGDSFLGAVA
jgi:hypothetical protein